MTARCLLLCALVPAVAAGQAVRYGDLVFGDRASGMGGAFTGLGTDLSAAYYNPAGLAFAEPTLFVGSLMLYGLDEVSRTDGLRVGDAEAEDLRSEVTGPFPTAGVSSARFGERHTLTFGSFVVHDRARSFDGRVVQESGAETRSVGSSVEESDRLLLIGPSYAFELSDRLSVGVSLFYARHDYARTAQASEAVVTGRLADVPKWSVDSQRSTFHRTRTTTTALLPTLGVLYRWPFGLRLGAAVFAPPIPLDGEAELTFRQVEFDGGGVRVTEKEVAPDTELQRPWSARVGIGFERPGAWAADLDVSYHAAGEHRLFEQPAGLEAEWVDPTLRRPQSLEAVVNVNLGGEWYPHRAWPLRVGAFTNRAANEAIPDGALTEAQPARIDEYGVATSMGYAGGLGAVNVSVVAAVGRGDAVTTSVFGGSLERVDVETFRLMLTLSGAVSFAKKAAKKVLTDD